MRRRVFDAVNTANRHQSDLSTAWMIDAGAYAELFDNSAMERRKRATRRGARFGYFRAGGVLQSRSANPPYLVDGQRDHLEMRFDRLAERRKPHGRSALEQCTAQFPLELANSHRKRWLRNAADRGRAGKSSCFADREEISDLLQVHGSLSAAVDLLLRAVVMGRSTRTIGSPPEPGPSIFQRLLRRFFQHYLASSSRTQESNSNSCRKRSPRIERQSERAKARRSAQRTAPHS